MNRRGIARAVAVVVAVLLVLVGVSVTRSLTAAGTDSAGARLAEWARGHGLSTVVDKAERATYRGPKVGGAPPGTSPLRSVAATPPSTLAPLRPFATPALPGEGSWHVLASSGGAPVLQVAYLRPDATHTSYTAAVAWMDTSRLRFTLHPGTQEPGHGPWPVSSSISAGERPSLLAAFNGGFRMDAARGGWLEGGRTVGHLRVGAASLVILPNGHATVGQWGRDVGPGTGATAVRQNLDLLVDHGAPAAGLAGNSRGKWGKTVGNRLYVWRSGVGVTSAGGLVYVSGDRLSATTLAALLARAGCVRAMELDINRSWTSFVVYRGSSERNLLPDMRRSPQRYDTTSTRDFVTVSLAR